MKRLNEGTGAKYSIHAEQAQPDEPIQPVSSAYKPVNIAAELGRQPNYVSSKIVNVT
jgi:hypothetical protein